MPAWLRTPLAFMAVRWRIWSPPLVLTIVVFLAVIFLTKGKASMPFIYRLF